MWSKSVMAIILDVTLGLDFYSHSVSVSINNIWKAISSYFYTGTRKICTINNLILPRWHLWKTGSKVYKEGAGGITLFLVLKVSGTASSQAPMYFFLSFFFFFLIYFLYLKLGPIRSSLYIKGEPSVEVGVGRGGFLNRCK